MRGKFRGVCPFKYLGRARVGERTWAIDEEAYRGNTHLSPRWWKQTEQYLRELMRIKNNLFEQNEKCEKNIAGSSSFFY